MTTPTPQTHRRTSLSTLLLALTAASIVLAFGFGLANSLLIKRHDVPQIIHANKTYTLLTNEKALADGICSYQDGEGRPVLSVGRQVDLLVNDDLAVKVVSAPLVPAKAAIAEVTFTDDHDALAFVCGEGHTYITTAKASTLHFLRLASMFFGFTALLLGTATLYRLLRSSSRKDEQEGEGTGTAYPAGSDEDSALHDPDAKN